MRYALYKGNIYLKSCDEDCFARDIKDGDIYDLYQLDFFVEYHGKTYIVYDKRQTEKYKVVICVEEPGSTEREPEFEYKTVDIHDCDRLCAHYIYFVRSGKKLDKEEAERVWMDAGEFETQREKHCHTKI